MGNIKSERLLVMIVFLLSFVLIPSVLLGEDNKEAEGISESKASIALVIKEDLISLNAKDASLKEILEEIGHEMLIDVIANISEEEKVTIKFDKLSIAEALEKLTTNFGYVMDSEREERDDYDNTPHITSIIVLPMGEETASLRYTTKQAGIQEEERKESSQPEPLKFEFDPSKFLKKEEK